MQRAEVLPATELIVVLASIPTPQTSDRHRVLWPRMAYWDLPRRIHPPRALRADTSGQRRPFAQQVSPARRLGNPDIALSNTRARARRVQGTTSRPRTVPGFGSGSPATPFTVNTAPLAATYPSASPGWGEGFRLLRLHSRQGSVLKQTRPAPPYSVASSTSYHFPLVVGSPTETSHHQSLGVDVGCAHPRPRQVSEGLCQQKVPPSFK